jgi:steroid delta-isomerase-like uncharacterized protein
MPTAAEELRAPRSGVEEGEAVAVARGYFGAVAARDAAGMATFWAPDGVGELHGLTSLRGPDEVREWFANVFEAMPDLRFVVVDVMAKGERVAVHWHLTGTFDGEARFEGLLANGAAVDLTGCDVLTIRGGRIMRNDAYLNGAQMARQLGALPPQGSAQESAMLRAVNLRTRAKRLLGR